MLTGIKLSNQNIRKIEQAAIWVAPALFIPGIRFFQDSPEDRNKLFVRDLTTYSIGAAIYFLTRGLAGKLINFKNESVKNITSTSIALTANILYAGIVAVKMSQLLDNVKKSQTSNSQDKKFLKFA